MPVTPEFVEQVIQRERPDGIVLSMGGQTALNCAVQLYEAGIFEKYDVKASSDVSVGLWAGWYQPLPSFTREFAYTPTIC